MVPDTVIQPGYRPGSPNAGSGFIDSTASGDRPPRAVFWILGASRTTGNFGVLTFILAHRPTPLPAGMYPIRPLADSTVWLEDYTAPYVGAGFPTDMNTARVGGTDFIIEPIVGSIVVDESDATGFVGNFSLRGSYAKDGVMRCLIASGRFSTRPN